jgi:hypothetical protein
LQAIPGGPAVGGVLDAVTLLRQSAKQKVGNPRFVFHNQDPAAHDNLHSQ